MAGRDDNDFDAELADSGDDRPGVDEVEGDDFSALRLGDVDDYDDDDDDDEDDDDDLDDDDDEDDDYPEDAVDEEIELVGAFYREDGEPLGQELTKALANDFDGLIEELRRIPGEAGALGMVSIDSDFFLLLRVRGRVIQVVLSDIVAAADWPLARDAADFLGADLPDDDDDSEPVGDLDMLADAGMSEFELEAICSDDEMDPLEALEAIAEKLGFANAYDKVATTFDL